MKLINVKEHVQTSYIFNALTSEGYTLVLNDENCIITDKDGRSVTIPNKDDAKNEIVMIDFHRPIYTIIVYIVDKKNWGREVLIDTYTMQIHYTVPHDFKDFLQKIREL